MRYNDEQIAEIIHETNRAVQKIQGDPLPSQPWDREPEELRQGVIANVALARAGASAAALHEAWLRQKKADGWTLGPKDNERKTHPCMVPYDQLPQGQRDKNRLFVGIVRELTYDMLLDDEP
jgi:hypothetical protein